LWPIATELHVSWHVGNLDKSGLVVLNVSFVARDPKRTSCRPVVLMHNQPGGDPTPSRSDIEMTRVIVEIANQFGIAIQDHIIVGKQGHASLKELKLI